MIQTNLSDKVEIVCSPDAIFTEYCFAIESGLLWFFGRGVSAFKAERSKNNNREQCVKLTPLLPLKPLAFSQITSVGALVKDGYWQKEIPFDKLWRIPGERHEVRDGHHRVFRADKEQTIMQQYGLDPSVSIGEIAYGLSDLITGFFWLGATWVQYQGSMGVVQTMTDKGFAGDELHRYITDPNPGYSIHQKVSTLS